MHVYLILFRKLENEDFTLLIVSSTFSVFSHLSSNRLKVVSITTATNTRILYAPTVILSHILFYTDAALYKIVHKKCYQHLKQILKLYTSGFSAYILSNRSIANHTSETRVEPRLVWEIVECIDFNEMLVQIRVLSL